MSAKTRVVGVNEFGGADSLQVIEVPQENAGPGEIRVRVHAAAVNPTDTYIPNGARAQREENPKFPYVPGMDIAGVVDEIGPDTKTELSVGDDVMGIVVPDHAHGAYRESIVLPAASVARAPRSASYAQAATLPMNGLTARLTLDKLGLSPGQILAVTGAAGAYGGYVIQLAKLDGLTVIADAAQKDEELVRESGADIVVRRGDDVADRFLEHFPDGVDGLADGAVLSEKVLRAVKDDGAVATVRFWKGNGERQLRFYPILVSEYAENHAALDRLREQAESAEPSLRVARTFPAARASEAHKLLAAGGTRGRIILDFADLG